MIDVAPRHLKVVKCILAEHVPDYDVRAFGSRITGKAEKFSDLDLVLIGPRRLNLRRLARLKDACAESNLPFIVDVLDWCTISKEFQVLIEKEYVVLQTAAAHNSKSGAKR